MLSAAAVRRQQLAGWVGAGGVAGLSMAAITTLMGPFVGLLTGAIFGVLMVRQTRAWRRARHALVLASAGRRDQAGRGRAARARHDQRADAAVPPSRGKLERQRGNLTEALGLYDRALGAVAQRKRRAMYWACVFDSGPAPRRDGQGRRGAGGAGRARQRAARRLLPARAVADRAGAIAFAGDQLDRLPADEELYEWSKTALGCTRFGTNLVLLAWALGGRGDADMERLLLREAGPRLATEFLAESFPALHAWYEQRRVAVGADCDDDE